MNTNVLIGLAVVGLAGMLILRSLLIKQKQENEKNEEFVKLVRKIHHLDEMISRLQRDDPVGWVKEHDAKVMIAKRIELYEEYCTFVGGHPVREIEYVNGLMDAALVK
jgi:hypothetical protein